MVARRKQQRAVLFKKDPHCYWCGRECFEYGGIPNGEQAPDNVATIDHLVSRFYRRKGENVKKVLACYKCNHARGMQEDLQLHASFSKKLSQKLKEGEVSYDRMVSSVDHEELRQYLDSLHK